MIIQVLPLGVFAEELNEEELTAPNYSSEIGESFIVGEDISLRDEMTKHFRCSDGRYIAASYSYPVHYEKDGQWEELDFTLIDTVDENGNNVYTTKDGQNYEISVPEDIFDGALSYSYDGYEISLTYQGRANQGQENKTKKAKVKKKDNKKKKNLSAEKTDIAEYNNNYMILDNAGSVISYEDVEIDTDFDYEISALGIKEDIIVKTQQNNYKYSYILETGGLVPSVESDNTIILTDTETNSVVYIIEAPIMYDNAGAESTDIKIKLKDKQDKYELIIEADKKWINAEEREFPVTIDPTVRLDIDKSHINDTYVDAKSPTTPFPNSGYLYVGRNSLGLTRTYVKFELPTLPKYSMIVSAAFSMFLYESDIAVSGAVMNLYDLANQSTWSSSSITWNNQPVSKEENGANSLTVVDYCDYGSNVGHAYNWDVTKVVKKWYSGEVNNGVLVAPSNESIGALRVRFLSSNSTLVSSVGIPQLTVAYRDTRGLEDYWSYSSYSAGDAGTAYINDYTGHLVFVRNDASTYGQRMPVTISHIYNLSMSGTQSGYSLSSGKGWQLSVQQSVKPTTNETNFSSELKTQYPYVYTDGDGTAHYLAKTNTTNKFEDEDGLGLTMTYNSSDVNARYTIKDNNDNIMIFNSTGNIVSIEDANENKIRMEYSSSTLTRVIDGAEHDISITNSSGRLQSIKAPDNRTCNYIYNASNQLTSVNLLNGKTVSYTYDAEGKLTRATASDGNELRIGYTISNGMVRVGTITIYSGGQLIQTIHRNYSNHNETAIAHSGTVSNVDVATWIYAVKQFDDFGRLICTYESTKDDFLGAANCAYVAHGDETDDAKHHVSTVGEMGDAAINLLKDSSFEGNNSAWVKTSNIASPSTASNTTSVALYGKTSRKINIQSYTSGAEYRTFQNLDLSLLTAGKTYTASVYVKIASCAAASNGGVFLQARCESSSTSFSKYSEFLTSATETSINEGWQKLSVTFTVPTGVTKCYVAFGFKNATGTAYFDGVQVEKGTVANDFNLIENSGFEHGNKIWTHPSSTSDGHFNSNPHLGSLSYRLYGKPFTTQEITQTINLESDAKETDTYVFSAWAKAEALSNQFHVTGRDKKFGIGVKITFTDNTVVDRFIPGNFAVSEWQFISGAFTLSDGTDTAKTPKTLTVYGIYKNQSNKVNFDDFSLAKEDVPSYTYNSKGNLVSAVDNAKGNQQMSYAANGVDMTEYRDAVSDVYTYTYDEKHNLKTATSTNGVKYNYSYDGNGNVTGLSVKNSSESKAITSGIDYTTDKSLVQQTTDARGNSTTYTYDAFGNVTSVTDPTGHKTTYTYDPDSYNLTQTKATYTQVNGTSAKTAKVLYSYDTNNRLTMIDAKSNYYFTYDANGNLTSATAGENKLIDNVYNQSSNALMSQTYTHSADEKTIVEYEYDTAGRPITLRRGSSASSMSDIGTWVYDNKNRVAQYSDLYTNNNHNYSYDSLGRFLRESVINTTSNELIFASDYGYDNNNNINHIGISSGNSSATMTYIYGADNLPQGYSGAGGLGTYGYDDLNRLTRVVNAKFADWTYEYVDIATLQTTTLIKNEISNDDSIGSVSYEYDKNGNITKKILTYQVNGVTCRYENIYTYDELNRLIVEQNQEQNQTIKYKYDAWGNIAMKWVYSGYFTATPSSSNLIKSYDYVYSSSAADMEWDDLLTEYDGEAIVYDNIGNPTTYRGKTMLWEGRNLTGFYNDDTAAIYFYDASGIRTRKICDGEVYNYYYVEGKLMSETCSQYTLFYTYDSYGNLSGIKKVDANGTTTNYGVLSNVFGDVVGIYDLSGNLLAKYTYDSWGKLLSITNASDTDISSTAGIWTQNSIRYRGYVYDNESGWYYLQSRYYDPEICRFINADGMLTATNDFTINLFAYAACNPIVNIDPEGTCPYNGTAADFYRLEYGLPSLDCTCLNISLSDGLSYVNDLFSFGTDAAVDYAKYANETGVRPNNIGVGTYNKQVLARNNSINSLSNFFGIISDILSTGIIIYDAVDGIVDNCEDGVPKDIIAWDVTVDLTFSFAGMLASTATSTAVGSMIGSFCPVPVVGTVGGAVAGFLVGSFFDWMSTEIKSSYRKKRGI